jgi:glutamate-1-semialdehyde 2,1-aminomutase
MTLHGHRSVDDALRARAIEVIPGGVYGHTSASRLWAGAPQFIKSARGSRFWDLDGHEYIDLMCSWGPMLHGHHHRKVDDAVDRQAALVNCGNGPAEVIVELAELFVETVEHANWAMFAKNGSDAINAAIKLARVSTGKRFILTDEGTSPPSDSVSQGTRPSENRDYIVFNDLASVEAGFKRHAGDVAGVIVSAFGHKPGEDQELTNPAFAQGLRQMCDIHGATLILDEIRSGFRLTSGGSWEEFAVAPDLSAWSKAIANGYPISALLGTDALRDAALSIEFDGSFWMSAVPMAAAIATINVLKSEDGLNRMYTRGAQLVHALRTQARKHGLDVRVTGPVTMPYLKFAGDDKLALTSQWAAQMGIRGVFVHPRHNWFLSTAHTADDINRVQEASDEAFAAVAEQM